MFDVSKIREDFPILKRLVHGKPLAYLDTAASAQKPKQVIEAQREFEENSYANVHRGIHTLSENATALFEKARNTIADFLGSNDSGEIVFVRNATEGINLIAYSWGESNIAAGDEILVTRMEHHANFVPWLRITQKQNAKLVIAELTSSGELDLEDFSRKLSKKTRVIAITLMSNVLGTINPIENIVEMVKRNYATNLDSFPLIVIDAAQAVPHFKVNVKTLECDALVFSGHKLYGPTGIGVLWMKKKLLDDMPPFLVGGQMIRTVYNDRVEYNDVPWKFEAGTPDITGAIGLATAIQYLKTLGIDAIFEHEKGITAYALEKMRSLKDLTLFGPPNPEKRGGLLSFVHKTLHAHDIASLLDEEGIAIRAGLHCPLLLHAN